VRRNTKTDGPTVGRSSDGTAGTSGKRTLYVQLTADEAERLNAIVAARQAETPGRKVSIAEVVRGWIRSGGPERV
jgi:hypothetical protein